MVPELCAWKRAALAESGGGGKGQGGARLLSPQLRTLIFSGSLKLVDWGTRS